MTKPMNEQQIDELLRMGGEFFGQFNDPTEIKATRENYNKIVSLHPSTYKYKADEQRHLIAWTVVIPTTKALADDFILRRITEAELLEKTCKQDRYDALYLFAALTLPQYQKNGYAREMLRQQIEEILGKEHEGFLFAWTVTEEGKRMVGAIARDLGREIALRRTAASMLEDQGEDK